MKLTTMNWNPSARQLRQFAIAGMIALPLFAWSWNVSGSGVTWVAAIAVAAGGLGLIWPPLLKPAYRLLSVLTWPIGFVAGEVLVAASYALVVVPLGLVGRLMGRQVVATGFAPSATTYWEDKPQPADPRAYFRQF